VDPVLGELHELGDVDDVDHLVEQIVLVEAHHVDRHLARPQVGAHVGQHLQELGHLGDVEVGDLLLQHLRRHPRHAGQAAEALGHVLLGQLAHPRRHVHRRVAERGEPQVVHGGLVDHVHAPEGEEDVGLDALTEGAVGHDQRRVGHVEAALGADEADLAIAVVVAEVGDDRCGGLGCGHGSAPCRSIGPQTQPLGFGRPAM
jgi:hypothetical protein